MVRIDASIVKRIKYLRGLGCSVPEISKEVQVSKTSVLRYIQGVQVLPEYLSEWAGKRGGSRKIRILKEQKAYEEGRILVNNISSREKLFLLSSLYWAEGGKKDFSLSNTDPKLIHVFLQCMRDIFNIGNSQIFINVRLYEDLDKEKCLEFWAKVVKIPKEQLKGVNILKGKKQGKLQYGMCRVRIAKGGDLLKKIKGVNQAIFESLSL